MAKAVNTVVDLYMHDGTSSDAGPPVQSQGTCLRTNAVDADDFSDAFSKVLAEHFKIAKGNVVYLRAWFDQAFEIMCKLRGYKAEAVQEQRILWTGHFSPWQSWQVAGGSIQEAEGLPNPVMERDEDGIVVSQSAMLELMETLSAEELRQWFVDEFKKPATTSST
jgi:hypothetical protein